MLTALALAVAAFVAGVTGAWSPCGFSMVDTLGAARASRGRAAVAWSCATFSVGAVIGGVVTFGALALLGRLLHAPGATAAIVVAVAIALATAAGEAAGVRIVPQIRRQVPEPWRRTMPLPVAAGLYGILLGLGFTTFVLTMAVWALAGISVALGAPLTGLAIGVGFGLGRALPVVVMAPRYDTLGGELQTRMCERPQWLRRLRLADAAMLAVAALVLATTGTAWAADGAPDGSYASADAAVPRLSQAASHASVRAVVRRRPQAVSHASVRAVVRRLPPLGGAIGGRVRAVAHPAASPSLAGGDLLWRLPAGGGVLLRDGARHRLDGDDLALGGRMLAIRFGDRIEVVARASAPFDVIAASARPPRPVIAERKQPHTTALAVSNGWLAWRVTPPGGRERIMAAPLPAAAPARTVAIADAGRQFSRPSISGDTLVYAVNGSRGSTLAAFDLARRHRTVLRRAKALAQLRDPAIRGRRIVFVVANDCRQQLRTMALRRHAATRTLWEIGGTASRDIGHDPGYVTEGSEASHCRRPVHRRTTTTLSSSALGRGAAYVTLLRPAARAIPAAWVARVPLR